MTDKDSKLDVIEAMSKMGHKDSLPLNKALFKPDGLFYEMRRELDNTNKLCRNLHRLDNERAKECMKLRRENEQLKTEIANVLGQIRGWERYEES